MHPGRRGERQDPGHLATGRLRARDRRRPAARRAGRHLHRQGRGRDGGPAGGARPPGVAASTFHAAALRQLRHFWPRVHGSDPPSILESKVPILAPLAAGLPGGYRYLAVRDLAARDRMGEGAPDRPGRVRDAGHRPRTATRPLPPDLMAGLYRRYETAKARAGRIDFEDMLGADDRADRGRRRDRRPRSATAIAGSRSTSTRTPTRSRRRSSTRGSAGARTWRSSATRTRRSTRSPAPRSDYLIGFADALPGARGSCASRPTTARRPRSLGAGRTGSSRRAGRRPTSALPGVGAAAAEAARREPAAGTGAGDRRVRDRRGRAGRRSPPRSGRSRGPGPRTARWRSSSGRTPSCPRSRRRSARPGSRSTSAASGSSPGPRSARAIARRAGHARAAVASDDAARRPARRRRSSASSASGATPCPTARPRARTARRGRHAARAGRGPGRGPIPRRTWPRSSPRSSGGPRSRPAGRRPASSS